MKTLLVLALFGLIVVPSVVLADPWNESGDAPDLPPGQETVGTGVLDQINGTIGAGGDADLYCINIPTTSTFIATTCGGANIDTQLSLYDMAGVGITFDDDDPGGCGLQSTITGVFIPGPGTYLIGISTYDFDPVGAGGDIWMDTPYNVERMPDGPGAPGPLTGWGGTAFDQGPYTIYLQGAEFCSSPTAVEQTTWGAIKAIYH